MSHSPFGIASFACSIQSQIVGLRHLLVDSRFREMGGQFGIESAGEGSATYSGTKELEQGFHIFARLHLRRCSSLPLDRMLDMVYECKNSESCIVGVFIMRTHLVAQPLIAPTP